MPPQTANCTSKTTPISRQFTDKFSPTIPASNSPHHLIVLFLSEINRTTRSPDSPQRLIVLFFSEIN